MVSIYRRQLFRVGEGKYLGRVFATSSREVCEVKGMGPFTSLKFIQILFDLSVLCRYFWHPYILVFLQICLIREVCPAVSKDDIALVLQSCDYDVESAISCLAQGTKLSVLCLMMSTMSLDRCTARLRSEDEFLDDRMVSWLPWHDNSQNINFLTVSKFYRTRFVSDGAKDILNGWNVQKRKGKVSLS